MFTIVKNKNGNELLWSDNEVLEIQDNWQAYANRLESERDSALAKLESARAEIQRLRSQLATLQPNDIFAIPNGFRLVQGEQGHLAYEAIPRIDSNRTKLTRFSAEHAQNRRKKAKAKAKAQKRKEKQKSKEKSVSAESRNQIISNVIQETENLSKAERQTAHKLITKGYTVDRIVKAINLKRTK